MVKMLRYDLALPDPFVSENRMLSNVSEAILTV